MSTTFSTLATENGVGSSSAIDTRRLEPQDAHYLSPPDRKLGPGVTRKRRERTRSSSRQRKGNYKKLLWFKQPFPDNYTDEKTFLDHLKRNPSLRPYEFWSLMADSTVIIQHLSSVAIFSCCFVAIIQKRVSPISVVTWASGCTVLAWILWDYWLGQDETEVAETAIMDQVDEAKEENKTEGPKSTSISGGSDLNRRPSNVGPNRSQKELPPMSPASATSGHRTLYVDPASSLSPRNQQRLATAKSALLIYAALLGLSPILKSLTKSTTSDSIWALSTWLLMMNVAFFDYRSGAGSQLPASISTNSAMMASTVLASRLDSTTHVFSLTLFSIEVFGLFPIFRRQLRAKSRYGHLALTLALVIASSGGVFMTLTGGGRSTFIAGVILGGFITFFCMAICCWWLIGLQKYKNEIHGPWDPAKPVIRRRYD